VSGRPVLWTGQEPADPEFFRAIKVPGADIDRISPEWDAPDRPRFTEWECRFIYGMRESRPMLIPDGWRRRGCLR